ncbi:MAG: thioesterase [Clostridia bacterium]|nr:thioesterase [Clostridia bacterium]
MENIISHKFFVNISDLDVNGNMRISAIANHYQNMAGIHSDMLGAGMKKLRANGKMWVITRMYMEFYRYPVSDEVIEIDTFPLKPSLSTYDREFQVRIDDEILAKASSRWCILNTSDFSVVPTSQTPYVPIEFPERTLTPPQKIAMDDSLDWKYVYTRTVRASDIDINRHLNNVKYLDLAQDCFSLSKLQGRKVENATINYLHQAPEGSKIDLFLSEIDDVKYIKGVLQDTSSTVFAIKITIIRDTIDK